MRERNSVRPGAGRLLGRYSRAAACRPGRSRDGIRYTQRAGGQCRRPLRPTRLATVLSRSNECVGWVEAPAGAVTHRPHVMGSASLHPSYEGAHRARVLRNVANQVGQWDFAMVKSVPEVRRRLDAAGSAVAGASVTASERALSRPAACVRHGEGVGWVDVGRPGESRASCCRAQPAAAVRLSRRLAPTFAHRP